LIAANADQDRTRVLTTMDSVVDHAATERRIIPRSLAITTDVFWISRLRLRRNPPGGETNTGRVYGLRSEKWLTIGFCGERSRQRRRRRHRACISQR
jgi:hypothetical protein